MRIDWSLLEEVMGIHGKIIKLYFQISVWTAALSNMFIRLSVNGFKVEGKVCVNSSNVLYISHQVVEWKVVRKFSLNHIVLKVSLQMSNMSHEYEACIMNIQFMHVRNHQGQNSCMRQILLVWVCAQIWIPLYTFCNESSWCWQRCQLLVKRITRHPFRERWLTKRHKVCWLLVYAGQVVVRWNSQLVIRYVGWVIHKKLIHICNH